LDKRVLKNPFGLNMENEDIESSSTEALDQRARKFTHAGYGFLSLNVIYLAIAMYFIPPFNLGLTAVLSLVAFVLLLGVLTYYLLQGRKRLAQVLAVIFALRSGFAVYSLSDVSTFPGVPYLLPCLLLTLYLLGRAGWNWPP
jgi:FtsH-binding integral membrane protein